MLSKTICQKTSAAIESQPKHLIIRFHCHWCSTDRYKFSTCSNCSDMEFGFDHANNYNHISMGDHTVSNSIGNLCVRVRFTKIVFQKAYFRFLENSKMQINSKS